MRLTVKIGRTICIIFLLSAINQLQAQSTDPTMVTNAIEESIDQIFKDYNAITKPGAAVAVMQHGEIVFKKGYGSANMEYDIPVTPSTIFHVASVSKQFTVYSILLLADQGKLFLISKKTQYRIFICTTNGNFMVFNFNGLRSKCFDIF